MKRSLLYTVLAPIFSYTIPPCFRSEKEEEEEKEKEEEKEEEK
jgi:hypothetical protein